MDAHSGDETIERWRKSYERGFSSDLREIDEWYARYRRDFAPDRYGHVEFSAGVPKKSVEKRRETRLSDLVLVGRGDVTNEKCGKFRGYYGCIQHEKHKGGVVFARPYFNSCDRPSCPKCFYNWAQREGYSNIEPRLSSASELLGLPVDHIVLSLPKGDYGLTYKEAKCKCIEILASCGVIGGVMIIHGNRMDKLTRVESFSVHFHIVGFVEGGYERCRRCTGGDCYACDGIEGRCYRAYRDTGYIVRVLGERRTVGGTAYYQLNHSSTDMSRRRFQTAVWFGRCGYRNLGVASVKPRLKCKLCGGECGSLEYVGSKHLVIDKNSPDFKKELFEAFFEDGSPSWRVAEAKSVEIWCMRAFRYCEHCSKKRRLSEDIGLIVRVGVDSSEFLFELSLIVPEASPIAFSLMRWFYRPSWADRIVEAEIQGRADDVEEEAFFKDAERLRKGEAWRRVSSER